LSRRDPQAIRDCAQELPQIGLDDALEVCLALLERDPEVYPRAATRWAGRLAVERSLSLSDAQLVLAALAALTTPASARAGAEALVEVAQTHGVTRAARVLEDWLVDCD